MLNNNDLIDIFFNLIYKIIKYTINIIFSSFSWMIMLMVIILIIVSLPLMMIQAGAEKEIDFSIEFYDIVEDYNSENEKNAEYLEISNKEITIDKELISKSIAYFTTIIGQDEALEKSKLSYRKYIKETFFNKIKKENKVKVRDGYKWVKSSNSNQERKKVAKYKMEKREAYFYVLVKESKLLSVLTEEQNDQYNMYLEGIEHLTIEKRILVSEQRILFPLPGDKEINKLKEVYITSSFGWRIHPVTHEKQFHNGIDIAKSKGTIIIAPDTGKITKIVKNHKTKGNYVVLTSDELKFEFLHLDKTEVKLNEKIRPGEIIGTVGNTGRHTGSDSSGYHLHYSIKKDGEYVDPLNYY